jgi:hypothetical protein
MREWTIRQAGAPEALKAAVAALYFNDSSDYESALWTVVRELCPQMAELLEANPSGAYHQADAFASQTSDAPSCTYPRCGCQVKLDGSWEGCKAAPVSGVKGDANG